MWGLNFTRGRPPVLYPKTRVISPSCVRSLHHEGDWLMSPHQQRYIIIHIYMDDDPGKQVPGSISL